MRSNIISFRFTDAELEALQALQSSEDKSPSQTAARLLRGLFTGIIEPSTVSSTSVDIGEIVKREVENAIANSERLQDMIAANTAYLATGINEIKHSVDERLGGVERLRDNGASLGQSPATPSTTVDTSVDIDSIRDRTLAKLKMGRQSPAGKAINAFIKELKQG